MAIRPRQIRAAIGAAFDRLERRLEAERGQLPLWIPVALGLGIAAWFLLPGPAAWLAAAAGGGAVALIGMGFGIGRRAGAALLGLGLLIAIGIGLAWVRAERVTHPVLERPVTVSFVARIERVEPLPARDLVRLRLAPVGAIGLPTLVRVNVRAVDVPPGAGTGAEIRLRARLMPPATPALPGAYGYARAAWFDGIGATGRALGPVEVIHATQGSGAGVRNRLSAHIQSQIGGGAGAIAATLATGDRGGINDADAEAMRRSGLAHLLSISGLHVTAVVGAAILAAMRILALFPALALRVRVPLIAAGFGAAAALGYTWLAGAEVPTVRSCIAALLILAAMLLGREAITLRLVATGAFVVLLLWPESLAGPSFQLSFAAVTAIIALHSHPAVQGWFERRDEGRLARLGRGLASLLLTGLVVEAVLTPIALFHFHKSGVYGAIANLVAIPLTTFVIMPAEAAALLLDAVGLGAPLWWVTGQAIDLILAIAHWTADAPGSVRMLPAMPGWAFAAMLGGGLWIALWRTRWRRWGAVPVAIGALGALSVPPPDLLVTGDGRHVAIRAGDGLALLRDRAGDYTRSMLGEAAGVDGEALSLSTLPDARCSADLCLADVRDANGLSWRVVATRSAHFVEWTAMRDACAVADIVIADRRLPAGCVPRWLRLDRATLAETGGVAITLASGTVRTVRGPGAHPWLNPPTVMPPRPARPVAPPPRPVGQ
ncbi:ComEC/Rec2 family competence protein [Sphingomonas sp. FW199]|uniref:ComEC/Rec2 family competence protein n=1 Tax=Sphingomonas sp. FW199 TaxID=3400217 RepID=UPI003CEEC95F